MFNALSDWITRALCRSQANGITITRVTQGITKTWPGVSTEPDQTRSQETRDQPLSRVQCSVSRVHIPLPAWLSQQHLAKSDLSRNSRDNLHKFYYHNTLSLQLSLELCRSGFIYLSSICTWVSSFLNFMSIKNLILIPANIHTKVTLNYSSKSHFEEVGNLVQTIYR